MELLENMVFKGRRIERSNNDRKYACSIRDLGSCMISYTLHIQLFKVNTHEFAFQHVRRVYNLW